MLAIKKLKFMKKYKFNELPQKIIQNGNFDETCIVSVGDKSLDAINNGRLRLRINQHGGKKLISNFFLSIESISGNIIINIGNDDSQVFFGEQTLGTYDLRLWRKSKVTISQKTTSNGVRIVCDNSEFICGEDCMFSDGILIQCADQHGIIDISTGEIINNTFKSIILGSHVWLGRQCTLSGGASVGDGSIIGLGAIVTRKIPAKVIAAGVPAAIIKENHTWSRSPVSLDFFLHSMLTIIANRVRGGFSLARRMW